MHLKIKSDITAFYDLSNCCNDDLEFISILLQILKLKPNRTIINNLENLRVSKYENDFNFLLDELKTGTIKNLYSIYEITQGLTDGND
jgi:hypothetical protein